MYYGEDKFSPLRIVAQIGLCQLGFYAGFVGLLCALAVMLGVPPDPRSAFEWRGFHLDTLAGCVQVLALGLNALLFSFVLLAVVGRARKCLDFAATAYLFHVAVVCVVAGVPVSYPASVRSDSRVVALTVRARRSPSCGGSSSCSARWSARWWARWRASSAS